MPPGQATFDAPTDYAHEFEDLASEAAGDDFVGEEEGGKKRGGLDEEDEDDLDALQVPARLPPRYCLLPAACSGPAD